MARIFRHHVSPVKLTLAVTDFALVVGCAFLAEWLRWYSLDLGYSQTATAFLAKMAIPVITLPLLLGFGAYQSDALSDLKIFFVRMVTALTASFLALAALAYMLPALPLWRSILLLTFVLSGASILFVHTVFILVAREGFLGRRVVILGNGQDASALKLEAERAPEASLKVVKILSVEGGGAPESGVVNLNKIKGLPDFLEGLNCDLIVIDDSTGLNTQSLEELIACKLAGVEIMDRLTFFEEIRGYVDLASVKADWFLFSEGFRGASVFERVLKRTFDVAVSVLVLALASPIFILSAAAVKLTSRGPVFYRQERVGLNGETFEVLKLRSMMVDAEKDGKPAFAATNDPRLTPVGGFLRRTRADEIPQILNVLKGDMSFVGPRPERPYFVDQLEEAVPFYRERHCLKPGITGWAQIRYPYGASLEDSRRKLEYDLYYIKNYSLFLDMLIVLQTLRVILFPHGVR